MAEEREPSWLDEVSLATKIVVVITVTSTVGYGLLKIFELLRGS
jgi:hypothetical protein